MHKLLLDVVLHFLYARESGQDYLPCALLHNRSPDLESVVSSKRLEWSRGCTDLRRDELVQFGEVCELCSTA